jgi:hypothetical protein
MSNVTCRLCHAENPTGSKYCNHCGGLLPPSTNLICPNCQTANPRSLLYCDECGTRLIRETLPAEPEARPEEPATTSAHRAFSLPARPPGETGELDLNRISDWLKGDKEQAPPGRGQQNKAEQERQTEIVLDDWLQELNSLADEGSGLEGSGLEGSGLEGSGLEGSGLEGSGPEGSGFDDLAPGGELSGEPPAHDTTFNPSGPAADMDDFPDWLTEAAAEEAEQAAGMDDFPDWLTEAAASEVEPAAGMDDFPDWLAEAEPAVTAEPAAGMDDFPDWLAEAEPAAAAEPAAGMDDLPDLLGEFAGSDAESEDEKAPAWLHDSMDDQRESTAVPPSDDWFTSDDNEGDETLLEAAEFASYRSSGEDDGPADEEFADSTLEELDTLFASYDARPSEQEPLTPPLATTGELPDWLTEHAPRGTGLLSPLDAEPDSTESPLADSLEWLLEEKPAETSEDIPGVQSMPAAHSGDEDLYLEDLILDDNSAINDATVVGDAAAIDEQADDALDWLAILDEETDTLQATAAEESAAPAEAADWLTMLEQSDDPTTAAGENESDLVARWFGDTDSEEWAQQPEFDPHVLPDESVETPADFSQVRDNLPVELAAADLPDWLQDSLSSDESQDVLGGLQDVPPGELPDWLQAGKDLKLGTPLPEGAQPESSRPTTTEWDDILGEMPNAGDLAVDFELPPASEFADLSAPAVLASDSELPGWLQALKPREVEDVPEPEEETAQTSGPLAGIRNVIAISPMVAEAHTGVRPPRLTVSRDQELQVELLRQLTRDDQKKATMVAPAQAGALPILLRLVLSFLVVAALLVGYFLPASGVVLPDIVPPPLPASANGAARFVAGSSGRPVLLAFEYTPAMAGELDLQAAMLLRQLSAAGSPLVIVSQYAAGVPVARQATAGLTQATVHEIGYLPGEAVGLRRLGACLGSGSECATVYGRALAPELQQALAEVALVIVITADRSSLVNWIEQVAAQGDVPVVAAVSQSLAPVAAAYYAGGQLQGTIGGLPAAAAYERFFPTGDRLANEQLAAQTIAQWLVVLLLIGGNVWYGLSALVRRLRPWSTET